MPAGTKNSRNAGFYLGATLGGSYTKITKTHGLNLNLTKNWADDTSHGDVFESATPGVMAFAGKLTAWYNSANATLKGLAINGTSEYFLAYPDIADTTSYWRGQCYVGLDEFNMDLGQTVDEGYSVRIANADVQFIAGGVAL